MRRCWRSPGCWPVSPRSSCRCLRQSRPGQRPAGPGDRHDRDTRLGRRRRHRLGAWTPGRRWRRPPALVGLRRARYRQRPDPGGANARRRRALRCRTRGSWPAPDHRTAAGAGRRGFPPAGRWDRQPARRLASGSTGAGHRGAHRAHRISACSPWPQSSIGCRRSCRGPPSDSRAWIRGVEPEA